MIDQVRMYTTERMVMWWWRDQEVSYEYPINYYPVPMYTTVGIFRLMHREDEPDTVIFECLLPGARDFIRNVGGTSVEVRWSEAGRVDNPHHGIILYRINDILPREWWANRIASVFYNGEPAVVRLHADCQIEFVMEEVPEPINVHE